MVSDWSVHQLEYIRNRSIEISNKYPALISACFFVFLALGLIYIKDIPSLEGNDLICLSTIFLGITTIYLALISMRDGKLNREQARDLAARERAISNYPFLSQKIDFEFPRNQLRVHGIDEASGLHYKLIIKNYGKGPAINQDNIYYIFFKGENQIHQNRIKITGEHDIIAPDGERILDMTILSENDWNLGMETKFDNVWVRLLHEDIQRNECCNCTTYEYKPQIKGKWGKTERYWYFASYPEISSEGCRECVWRALEDAME